MGGDVNPNRMDAMLAYQATSWILAELIRIFHRVPLQNAQELVDSLTDRHVPLVWLLQSGKTRILNPSLSMRERMLVALYYQPTLAMSDSELVEVVEYSNPSAFRSNVLAKAHKLALIDYDSATRTATLSPIGVRWVEENIELDV